MGVTEGVMLAVKEGVCESEDPELGVPVCELVIEGVPDCVLLRVS